MKTEFEDQITESISDCDTFMVITIKDKSHQIFIDTADQSQKGIEDLAGAMLASLDTLIVKGNTIPLGLGAVLIIVFSTAIRTWNQKIRKLTRSVITINQ